MEVQLVSRNESGRQLSIESIDMRPVIPPYSGGIGQSSGGLPNLPYHGIPAHFPGHPMPTIYPPAGQSHPSFNQYPPVSHSAAPFQHFSTSNQFMPRGFAPPTSSLRIPSQSALPQQRGPTVYIGHLTPDTDDATVRHLLAECGRVVRWARTQDPSTKKLSSFGFCEFESPLGVIRAVRCLNGLSLDGQSLVANCEDKVKDGLNQWRKDRHNKLQEENPSKSTQEIEAEIEKEDERIEQMVKRIALEYKQKKHAESVESAEEYRNNPSEPPTPSEQQPTPSEPLPLKPVEVQQIRDEQQRKQSSSPRRKRPVITPGLFDTMYEYIEVPTVRKLSYKETQRIQKWNNRLKEARSEFRERVYQWERREPVLLRERNLEREATMREIEDPSSICNREQKKRLIDCDVRDLEYYVGPTGTVWEGSLGHRQQQERSQWLVDENKMDEADAEREEEEREKAIREERIRKEREEDEQKKMEEEERQRIETETEKAKINENVEMLDEAGPINRQVQYGGGFKSLTLKRTQIRDFQTSSHEHGEQVASVFGDTEEEDEHGSKKLTTVMDLHLDREARAAERKSEEERQELFASLAAQIPKTIDELFNYSIDWDILHKNQILTLKVEPWISKKVTEFLGESEPELVAFISKRIAQNPTAVGFLEELREFLDEDATGFVEKLWKMLIFEGLRLGHAMKSAKRDN